MKTIRIILITLIALTGLSAANEINAQPGFRADISFNTFYNELSPYGQWMDVPRYGKVWRYQESGFRPYSSNGQWAYTDMGWSWESGYDWGWAPFHYGRWELDDYYGWIWIPGYDYAPAWVSWSQADDYYGWAPLGFGLDINISIGRIPSNRWMYASRRYITQPHIDRYCLPYDRSAYYAPRQRAIGNIAQNRNTRYFSGPDRRDVERYTHDRIQPWQGNYGRSNRQADGRNNGRQDRNNNDGGGYQGNRDRGNISAPNDNPRNTPGRSYEQEERRNIARADIDARNNNNINRNRPGNNDLRNERELVIRQHEQSQARERQQAGEQENRQRQERSQQMEQRRTQSAPQRQERNNNDSRPSVSSPAPRENRGGQARDYNAGRERLERSRRN